MRLFLSAIIKTLSIFLLTACLSNQGNILIDEAFEKNDTCLADPMHTYEVYVPKTGEKCEGLPLLIIIDPHGSGKQALERFRSGADQYACMLAASNRIMNNFPDYLKAINTLIQDVRAKYPVSDEVYLAGFSGGSRMILNFARNYQVTGVLVSGGLAPADQLEGIQGEIIGLAGMADFNFIETAQYLFNSNQAPKNLHIILTSKGHEWPSPEELKSALAYLLLQSEAKQTCYNRSEIPLYINSEKLKIEKLRREDHYLQAGLLARNISASERFNSIEDFISLRNSIEFSEPYMAEQNRLKESIRFELAVRNEYNQALQHTDAKWWGNEINTLDEKIKSDKDVYRKYSYLRIKGFLGILCYSLTGNSIQQNDYANTERLLSIYKLLEPQNPDMLYFSAVLANRIGDTAKAREYLLLARKAGFTDRERAEKEFPEGMAILF